MVIQFILVQFGGDFTKTQPLSFVQWMFCIGIGFLSLPLGVLIRLIPVPPEKIPVRLPVVDEARPLLVQIDRGKMENNEHEAVELSSIGIRPLEGNRSVTQNWAIASQVLTQVRVVSAFRRSTHPNVSIYTSRSSRPSSLTHTLSLSFSLSLSPSLSFSRIATSNNHNKCFKGR